MIDDAVSAELRRLSDLFAAGQPVEVMEQCQALLRADPECSPVLMVMSLIAWSSGDEGLALQLLERAHRINPECHEYANLLASMYTRIGRLTDGLFYAKLAVALQPDPALTRWLPSELASYHASLERVGISQHHMNAEFAFRQGAFEEAIRQGREELRINRDHLDCMIVVARALLAVDEPDAALSTLRAAVHVAPRSPWVHVWLAEALTACGLHDEAFCHQRLALVLDSEDESLEAQVIGGLSYQTDANWAAAKPLLEAYRARTESPIKATLAQDMVPSGLIGIVWDQCHEGPLLDFVLPVLRGIDRTVLYRLNARKDIRTEEIRAAIMRVRDSVDVDDCTLGRIMVGDMLRATLNLCCPRDEASFPTFSGPGASVGFQWLSEPLIDRAPAAEYVIGGPETADIDRANFGVDRTIVLDRLVAYDFPKLIGPGEALSALPRDQRGHVTFGVWSDGRRFTADAVALWSRVLLAVPGSLLLIGGHDHWEAGATQRIGDWFAGFGVCARVRFQDRVIDEGEAVVDAATLFWQNIDILLDATPVSGGGDVARALWMGVPVVALRGTRRIGRLGASILHAAGCAQWIGSSPEDYVKLAADLAGSSALAELRATLRARVEASPLADGPGLGKQLVAAIAEKAGMVYAPADGNGRA